MATSASQTHGDCKITHKSKPQSTNPDRWRSQCFFRGKDLNDQLIAELLFVLFKVMRLPIISINKFDAYSSD